MRVISSARAARRSQFFGSTLGELLGDVAQMQIRAARRGAREIVRESARRRRDRHVVVVEDDDEALVAGAGVVHGLVGHAGRHGAIADDGDDVIVAAREIARDRHAEAGGNRGRRMRGAEGVVFALGALGEAGESAAHAQRADLVAPAGQDLVRVALMADVPDQAIARRIEEIVQGDRQLDDAEAGAEVPARDGDGVDGLRAQLVGHLPKIGLGKTAQVLGRLDLVEERGLAHCCDCPSRAAGQRKRTV